MLNADAEPDDLRNFLASLTGFVLENNIELQDGKTIGFTAEDKHTIIDMASPHPPDHLHSMILLGPFCQVVVPVLVLRDQAA